MGAKFRRMPLYQKTKFLFSILLWSLFIYWTNDLLMSNFNQLMNPKPTSSVESKFQHTLEYPQITICNLALNVELSHIHCSKESKDSYNILLCQSMDMTHEVLNKDYKPLNPAPKLKTKDIKNDTVNLKAKSNDKDQDKDKDKSLLKEETQINTQNCLVQNRSDHQLSEYSNNSDLLLIAVSINISDYPDESRFSGVTVYLHDQHVDYQTTSGIMVSPGQPVVFRLKKTMQTKLDSSEYNSWEANLSYIGTNNFRDQFGHVEDTVVIGINFHDHHVLHITEMNPYGIFNFFAEIGGILGLLLGYSMNHFIDFLFKMQQGIEEDENEKPINDNNLELSQNWGGSHASLNQNIFYEQEKDKLK